MKNLADMKVLLVGLGQIGGSLGLDLVGRQLVAEVVGFDTDPITVVSARRGRAVHRVVSSLSEGVRQADLVILAVPVREIIKLLPAVAAVLEENSAVLDVGSTKGEVLKTVARLSPSFNYLGGHPLAGSEKTGWSGAEANKFAGSTFVLTPTNNTSPAWLDTARELVEQLGAQPLVMNADEHDRLIALTSGLPYLLSLALCRLAEQYETPNKYLQQMVAGSFKSAVRVARSAPELTRDILWTNRSNISRVIDEVIAELSNLKLVVEKEDKNQLTEIINKARQTSQSLSHG